MLLMSGYESSVAFAVTLQPYSSADRDVCAATYLRLPEIAKKEGIMLGYEALAWG